jgi:hypothetical protein
MKNNLVCTATHRSLKFIVAAALPIAMTVSTSVAHADDAATNTEVGSVELVYLGEGSPAKREIRSVANSCAAVNRKTSRDLFAKNPAPAPAKGNLSADDIGKLLGAVVSPELSLLGQQLWQLIEDGKPVVKITTPMAHALPDNVSCWKDMSEWQKPRYETYGVVVKNIFGMTLVRLEFYLGYFWGGKYRGKGAYLSNVTVKPKDIWVAPLLGLEVNADVEIPQVVNMASLDSPVAGMEVALHWSVKGINHSEGTIPLFIRGDGAPTLQVSRK